MVRYLNLLALVIIVLLLYFYLDYHNKQLVTVYLSGQRQYSGELGKVVLTSFVLGILAASLVTLYFTVKGFIRERRLIRREQERLAFYQAMGKARALQAAQQWASALKQWQGVLKKDPTATIARVESSFCLEQMGEPEAALEKLNEARSLNSNSEEVLLKGADLNLKLGNKTASLDNLELLLRDHPSPGLLLRARNLARELGIFQKAAQFQEKLEQYGEVDREAGLGIRADLAFEELLTTAGNDKSEFLERLKKLCHEQPYSVRALSELASLQEAANDIDGAAEALIRRARLLETVEGWKDLAEFWKKHKSPERTLAAFRAGIKESEGKLKVALLLDLALAQLQANMLSDAEKSLAEIQQSKEELDQEQISKLKLLQARVALLLRDYQRAEQSLQ